MSRATPLISPEAIIRFAERLYDTYCDRWLAGNVDDFFPVYVRKDFPQVNSLSKPVLANGLERLRQHSKTQGELGYSIDWQRKLSRVHGNNELPRTITIESLPDLLKLARQRRRFEQAVRSVERIRAAEPELEHWLRTHFRRLPSPDRIESLLEVIAFTRQHPHSELLLRDVPIRGGTKFIEQNLPVLRQWLDLLLPPEQINSWTTSFASRYGFRETQPLREFCLLDPALSHELGRPDSHMSLPLHVLESLAVSNVTVIVVENRASFAALLESFPPLKTPLPRTMALWGCGDAVVELARLDWLEQNRLLYWGDIDLQGFQILSRFRSRFPATQSLLMEEAWLDRLANFTEPGKPTSEPAPHYLNAAERQTYERCRVHNLRLEQERLKPQLAAVIKQLILQPTPT